MSKWLGRFGGALDWGQRVDLAWTWGWRLLAALPFLGAGISAYLARIERVPRSQVFLFGVFGFAGGLFVLAGVLAVLRLLRSRKNWSPSEPSLVSPHPRLNAIPNFIDDRLVVAVTNNGPTASFVAQVQFVRGINNNLAFPIAVRWKGQTGQSQQIIVRQTQVLELIDAPEFRHEQEGRMFLSPLLLTLNGETVRLDRAFVDGDLDVLVRISEVESGESVEHMLRVHLKVSETPVTRRLIRDVCHLKSST